MKTRLLTAVSALLLAAPLCCRAADVTHRFFRCGWRSGGPSVFNAALQAEWTLQDGRELSDGWVLPDGGVVYSFSDRKKNDAGVIRLDAAHDRLWEYRTAAGRDNHSCQPLPDGGFLLGESATNGLWIVEIDAEGKESKRIRVADGARDSHHAFRHVRKTRAGTYLAPLMRGDAAGTLKGGAGYEWDASGKVVRTFPHALFTLIRLPDGNTLASCGHAGPGHGMVIEYDRDGKIAWEVTVADVERMGIRVGMCCGIQRLPNGNTVITSVAHGKPAGRKGGNMPKAFEVTRAKELVWQIPAATDKWNMGVLQILDVPGDARKGEVLR